MGLFLGVSRRAIAIRHRGHPVYVERLELYKQSLHFDRMLGRIIGADQTLYNE